MPEFYKRKVYANECLSLLGGKMISWMFKIVFGFAYINKRLYCKPTVVRHQEDIRIKKWKCQIKRMLMMISRFFPIFHFIFFSFKYVKMFFDAPVPLILVFLGFSTSLSLSLKNVDDDLEVRQLG